MAINSKTFSENLTRLRRQKGLSQKDLAKESGISARMIGHYEKHVAYPSLEKIETLANALNVSISDLLGLKNNKIDESELNDFDIRTIKKLKNISLLNPQDRFSIYQMIDLLLQKDEYKDKKKQLAESKK